MASTQTTLHRFYKPKKNVAVYEKKAGFSEIIASGSQHPTGQVTWKASSESSVSVGDSASDLCTEVLENACGTPKQASILCSESSRKRKREQQESSDCQSTPKRTTEPSAKEGSSAKRCLVLLEDPVAASKKKVTPEEIKAQLGRCNRLHELHSRLLRINKCEEKLKGFRSRGLDTVASAPPNVAEERPLPQLGKFGSLKVEVPISPVKSPAKTPSKSTPQKVPCFERFLALTEDTDHELVLPHHYQVIKEVFRAVDTIVSLLHNRQEIITFAKLKPAVQEMIRKSFTETQLGQMKTVFPLAYFFQQEQVKNSTPKLGPDPYQLTVTANLDFKKETSVPSNLLRKFDESDMGERCTKYRKMDSVVLVERRVIFHNSLLNILRHHHDKFLECLDPPVVVSNIKRWHPSFPLDEIPEPEPSPLPQAPDVQKFSSAQEVFEKAHQLFSVNNRMRTALGQAFSRKDTQSANVSEPTEKPVPSEIAAALKGVSLSLLEKIRAREAARTSREMTRSSKECHDLERLSRLPELARILRNLFVAEKKVAIPWETVVSKLCNSSSVSSSLSETDSHLHLLMKEVPDWCTIHKVRSGTFLKLNRSKDVNEIISQLEKKLRERR